ncbi:MAG: hypothetical protein Q8S73_23525 [Deltaproteobacteria bacterium]|nr:hypothetical protein [Myxococcales bacterium]MDP3217101.1 hypothetical protein [Deltaproteobacteria bacterium]
MISTRWPIALALCSLSLTVGCGDDPVGLPPADAGGDVPIGTDLGPQTDARTDTGTPTDNGTPTDMGTPTDDGITKDAGGPVDTGDDAGVPSDLGMDGGQGDVPTGDVPVADDAPGDAPAADVPADVPTIMCPMSRETITLPAAAPVAVMGTTTGTGVFASNRCQANTGGPEAVYSLVITARTGVILSTDNAGTTFDTSISIRRSCTDAATELSCDDDSGIGTGRTASSVLRAVLEPGTYTVIVDGFSSGMGTYALTAATFTPGANTTCESPLALTVGTAVTAQTLTEVGGPGLCAPGLRPGGQRFYSVTLPAATLGTAVLTRPTGSWSPALRAIASCDVATCLANVSSSSSPVTLYFANPGATPQTVVLSVASNDAESTVTPFDLVATTAPYVPGQLCDAPVVVAPGATLMAQDAAAGVRASSACSATAANGGQLFYSVTVPAGSRVPVRAVPAGAMAAWTPTLRSIATCTATTCRDSSTAAAAGSPAALTLTNGGSTAQTFLLSVAGSTTSRGTFDLEVGATATLPGYTSAPITAACDDVSGGAAVPSTATGGAYGDDTTSAIADLPFAVPLFGESRTRYSVSSNGILQLYGATGGSTNTGYTNTALPSSGTPNGMVAALWDDLRTVATTAVRAATFGTGSERRFVVQWSDFTFGDPDDEARVRMQVKLFETTGVVEIHYCDITAGNTRASGDEATVGIENADGTLGTQISLDTAGAAVTGSGYRLTPR